VRSWASDLLLGTRRRDTVVRGALAVVVLGALVWALPIRRPGQDAPHHGEATLDPFEKAGISELKEGQRGPLFALAPFTEGAGTSLADYADKLVVLNFWATWCEPCAVEMPTLEALWQRYRARGLVVLGVAVDRGAPRALLEPYIRHHRLTFPILLDPDLAALGAWRINGLPATFLIRPGGEAIGMAIGAREWTSAEMRALIEGLLPGAHAHR
jgi:peroxiredoxin